jgi:hypothetical protein
MTEFFFGATSADAAVPWWLQQEQQAAADSGAAVLASLMAFAAANHDQASCQLLPRENSITQNSQPSASEAAARAAASKLFHEATQLAGTLSWILCNASPAAIACMLPALCDRIARMATSSVFKASQLGSTQNAAFQPRVAVGLLQWKGLWEEWMEKLPDDLATAHGIEALVACTSDRDSSAFTDLRHITYLMLLKHALLCASLSVFHALPSHC